jgi:hypothetical protein
MHTRFRFIDGLAEDMVGYIFPRGNGVGVPGEDLLGNPGFDSTDRFGCGHSDDSEAASSQAGDIIGRALVRLLDSPGTRPEPILTGRYLMHGGRLSRDPLGGPQIKCHRDLTYNPGRPHAGPAVGVKLGDRVIRPRTWMSLSGRPQEVPDRNTRGFFTRDGRRVWLNVFPPLPGGAG